MVSVSLEESAFKNLRRKEKKKKGEEKKRFLVGAEEWCQSTTLKSGDKRKIIKLVSEEHIEISFSCNLESLIRIMPCNR